MLDVVAVAVGSRAMVLIARVDDVVKVEWNKFGVADDDRFLPGEPSWLGLGDTDTMRTGVNGVLLTSAGTHHWAKAVVEAWSAEPGQAGSWDAIWEDELRLTSGVVRLVEVTGASERSVALGGPGMYRVRACSRGRADARVNGDRDNFGEHFEHWLLRFWPVSAQGRPAEDAVAGVR
ncbi:hypothetical protein [Actinokineospora globicatena]|uniref:Uncharacterized protein n=1 Tax=Actinokineospora globicatena TaxID=103729 RepID=A0A9W6QLN3_9PSEU|nr:hypothetical protein [Actinokineospora globicatena]GLW92321.1 hypothetical protein Aglo03_31370 [Actinokineospora globicatena]